LKKIILFFLFLITVVRIISTDKEGPIIVALLMIKDEAHCIKETLMPLVEGGIGDLVILDTGSTDGTQDIIKNYFKATGVNGLLFEEPFIDFATSRNRLLELAEREFPGAHFWLMLDANWYLRNTEKLLIYTQTVINKTESAYAIDLYDEWGVFKSSRLFRVADKIRYHGAVHEHINCSTAGFIPPDIYIDVNNGKIGLEKTVQRCKNSDVKVLHDMLEKNPHDTKILFYLGQTYNNIGDHDLAFTYYQRSIDEQTKINPDHSYEAAYRIAKLSHTRFLKHEPGFDWEKVQDAYLNAYNFGPWHIEPLVHIAVHYLMQHEFLVAYTFIQSTVEVPYPKYDVLGIEHEIFLSIRYEIVAFSAWIACEFEVGLSSVEKAIVQNSTSRYLQDIRDYYLKSQQIHKLGNLDQMDDLYLEGSKLFTKNNFELYWKQKKSEKK